MSLLNICNSASTNDNGLQTAYRSSTYHRDMFSRLMLFSAGAVICLASQISDIQETQTC